MQFLDCICSSDGSGTYYPNPRFWYWSFNFHLILDWHNGMYLGLMMLAFSISVDFFSFYIILPLSSLFLSSILLYFFLFASNWVSSLLNLVLLLLTILFYQIFFNANLQYKFMHTKFLILGSLKSDFRYPIHH